MRTWVLAALAATFLAGCGPGDTRKLEPAFAPVHEPSQVMRDTFANCTWGEVKGAVASIWSYACGAGYGNIHLVADDALPGFAIESGDPAAPGRNPVIRFFDKPADAPIESILPAIRAASGPAAATCVLTPARPSEDNAAPAFVFAPEGVAKTAYETALAGDEIPEPPCGALGISHVGDRTFRVIGPDKVVFVEHGSEIQIFDVSTLTLLTSAPTPASDSH